MSCYISRVHYGNSALEEFSFTFKAIRPHFVYFLAVCFTMVSPLSRVFLFRMYSYNLPKLTVQFIEHIFVLFSIHSNVSFRSRNATLQVILKFKLYLHCWVYAILLLLSLFDIIRTDRKECVHPLHFRVYLLSKLTNC